MKPYTVYRGYAIYHRPRLQQRPYRCEVPGKNPKQPGAHADKATLKDCKQFIDQQLERINQ